MCEMYRYVGLQMRSISSATSWSLRGKTNHEPRNAGRNQGSQTIDPSTVSTRMPAWPIEVARMIVEARATSPERPGTQVTSPTPGP